MIEKPQLHPNQKHPHRRRFRLWRRLTLTVLLVSLVVLVRICAAHVRLNNAPEVTSAAELSIYTGDIPAAAAVTPEQLSDLPELDPDAWYLQLVRYEYPLETDFVPDLTVVEGTQSFDSRVYKHLSALIVDARAAGYSVYVCSLYRSYDTQYEIYWNHVYRYESEGMSREEAEARTRLAVNYPGASEHQLGLAADLLEYEDQDMEPYIGGSGLMLWLEEHCAEYGFIVRYPDGKTDITGIEYEPWHLRYVGTEAAAYIMEHKLTLEEFLALYE